MFGRSTLLIVTLAVVLAQIAGAAGFSYRYRDNSGSTHIGYSVPPQFVENGYEVLNDRGRVVEVVLPKKVLDERAQKLMLDAENRQKLEMQRTKDEALLRFYSSVEDIERVRARKLGEFDNFISIQNANITSYQKKIANLQSQAANLERMNREIPNEILETLETLEHKVDDAREAIGLKQQEKQKVSDAYDQDIKRLSFLLNKLEGNPEIDAPEENDAPLVRNQ